MNSLPAHWLSSAWEVLVLFLIPIGGGIPAGVVLAHTRGLEWPIMVVLYFISDIILACVFEPVVVLIRRASKHSPFLTRMLDSFKMSMDKIIQKYGVNPSPFTLIMVSFAADPMTGRTVALAAGHNFFSGWALAISGDMIFFAVLMISTLWLNKILGDGTWTAIIITVAVMVIHSMVRRFRERRAVK
jgi:hypothetical protein